MIVIVLVSNDAARNRKNSGAPKPIDLTPPLEIVSLYEKYSTNIRINFVLIFVLVFAEKLFLAFLLFSRLSRNCSSAASAASSGTEARI